MANPHKGEVEFEAVGKTYKLRYSTNAICELEDKLDRSFTSIARDIVDAAKQPEKVRFGTLRAIFWAGLQDCHPDLSVKDAGDLMVEVGGVAEAMQLISEAFVLAFPAQEETKGGRPTQLKKGRGIGLAS